MDIPMGAFGPEQQDVVTAPSATHLYCMRHLWERYKAYCEALKWRGSAVGVWAAGSSETLLGRHVKVLLIVSVICCRQGLELRELLQGPLRQSSRSRI